MRKSQKQNLIDEYFKLVLEGGEASKVDDLLFKAVDEKKLTSRHLLVYGMHRTYGAEQIQKGFDRAGKHDLTYRDAFTKWELQYYINNIKENMQKTTEILNGIK